MNGWNLNIVLRSDFCTAVGENTPGIFHVKTALEYGIPYIPAKRIKGCLLEAGREMVDNGVFNQQRLFGLFGRQGENCGRGIRIYNGHLHSFPEYLLDQKKTGIVEVKDYNNLLKVIQTHPGIEDSLLEDIFTRARTRTAIEGESGVAKEHTLHTVQVVPAGVVFTCRIEGDLDSEEEEALSWCVKGLRHMGVGITRGLGEVRCSLEADPSKERIKDHKANDMFQNYMPDAELSLSYAISLDEPIILTNNTDDCCDQIPGSALLGALAGMYIRNYALGEYAHKNKNFGRIFLHDGVQFGYSNLKKDGMLFVPCPRALALLKDKKTVWINTMKDVEQLRRKRIGGQIVLRETELYLKTVEKEIHFHHARPADRGIGHALNDRAEDSSIPTGQFFQYQAISKGQVFEGSFRGRAHDIQQLFHCLKKNQFRLKLGRSKTAEYGSCTIQVQEIDVVNNSANSAAKGTDWFLWLIAPLVYKNQENGTYVTDVELFRKQLCEILNCEVEVEGFVCDYMVLNGYHSKWGLPSVPYPAWAIGSTFHIKTDKTINANELLMQRWGKLTGRGCGQVIAVPWDDVSRGEIKNYCELKKDVYQGEEEVISKILTYMEKINKLENERKEVLEVLRQNEVGLPPSSTISLFLQIICNLEEEDWDLYAQMQSVAERIRGEQKKNCAIQFLKPCENRSHDFVKIYLENAKWRARSREERG